MNKEELLKEITYRLSKGEISREELLASLSISGGELSEAKARGIGAISATRMLYIIGAVIAIAGIIIFISQIWSDIGSFGRIFVTLGLGLVMTALGSFLLNTRPQDSLGTIFHFLGGLLIPGGAMVTLYEMNYDFVSLWPVAIVFAVIFAFYLILTTIHKRPVLAFFAVASGTTFVYLTVASMVDEAFYRHGDLYAYLTMIVGVSYLLLGNSFRDGWNRGLVGLLNFFGSVALLGAAFTRVFDSSLWQMLYFVFVVGGVFMAVRLKSRGVLVVSTIFLIAHVSYITGKYFADSLGWPIALVILGFIFIGLGYASINISKKYIRN